MSESKETKQPQAPARKTAAPAPAKAPAAKQDTKKAGPKIYVGPTLRGGKLAKYTIFKNGELPVGVAELAESHKEIKGLIVCVQRLTQFEQRLKDPSSVEAARFRAVGQIKFNQGDK